MTTPETKLLSLGYVKTVIALNKEIEALRAQVERCAKNELADAIRIGDLINDKYRLQMALDQCRAALELIASPIRPDGTWNRDRAACQQIAREAIDKARKA